MSSKDANGKKTINDIEILKNYILNIYKTLLTRGIRGTYIYCCNEGLRDYIREFLESSSYDGYEYAYVREEDTIMEVAEKDGGYN